MVPQQFLLTGASGFLGSYIQEALVEQGIAVISLGRAKSNTIICDLANETPIISRPVDVVVHTAAKAHSTPKTDEETKQFFDVNTQGTKNLCAALSKLHTLPSAFIFISTVAVYGLDNGEMINEKFPLNGNTPYAKSKIEAELFLINWCKEKNVKLSILRLPLIAGLNPPGNLNAMIKGISRNRYLNIDGGNAKKSIVMANDVAKYISKIVSVGGIYNLTDGYHPSFKELAESISKQLNKKPPKNIPFWVAKTIALFGDLLGSKAPINSDKLLKITSTLTFDDTLARQSFGWKPSKVLDCFVIGDPIKK